MPSRVPHVVEPRDSHSHTIIFLHGRGGTSHNLANSLDCLLTSSGKSLYEQFPSFRWVFPTAPLVHPAQFPRDVRSQWFDVWNARDLTEREELQADGLRKSVKYIESVVEDEVAKVGGDWKKVVLMGISQGAATAAHTLLHLRSPSGVDDALPGIGAYIGICGRLPFPGRSLRETRQAVDAENEGKGNQVIRGTPVLLEHSRGDLVIKIEDGRTLRDGLAKFGASLAWREYPGNEHWITSPQGVDDIVSFLTQHLGLLA